MAGEPGAGRAREVFEKLPGKLQTDGYSAYESLAKERDDLILVGCWAHARRGFHEALTESKLAAWFVRQIGLLYAVEKELRREKSRAATTGRNAHLAEPARLGTAARAMELVRRRTLAARSAGTSH